MRTSFTTRPVLTVTLTRDSGEGVVETTVDLRPWSLGFPEYLDRVFPAPVRFENGKPVPDPGRASEHSGQRMAILVARCLGDQLDAKAPAGVEDRAAWEAYAKAVLAEFEAANLVEGDVIRLMLGAQQVNQGAGKPGKA